MSPGTERAGTVEIEGKTWRWAALDPDQEAPFGQSRDQWMFVRFRSPGDRRSELRALAPAGRDAFSEEELCELFRRAWAVSP